MRTDTIIDDQWYEVLRSNGTKQYAKGSTWGSGKDGYLLWGSGFIIYEFDAVSVTPIDKIPDDRIPGIAHFDGGKDNQYKAICNMNNRWNGWMMPFIHEDDIERLCKQLTWGGPEDSDYQLIEFTTDRQVRHACYYDQELEHEDLIEPT